MATNVIHSERKHQNKPIITDVEVSMDIVSRWISPYPFCNRTRESCCWPGVA